MKMCQRRLIPMLTFIIPAVWSLDSSAQTLPSKEANQPSAPAVSREDAPDPPTKYQYTLEVIRLGGGLRYSYLFKQGDVRASSIGVHGHAGVGFKDVWNGLGLSVDYGASDAAVFGRFSNVSDGWIYSPKLTGYWLKTSGAIRISSSLPGELSFLYIQPSYTYQEMWVSSFFSYYDYRLDRPSGEYVKKYRLAPHKLSLGPSMQLDHLDIAIHGSSGLALSIGQGLKEFEVTIIDLTLVLQPIWF